MERSRTPGSTRQVADEYPPTPHRTPAASEPLLTPEPSKRKRDRSAKKPRSRKWNSHARSEPWESDAELVRQILSGSRDHFEMLYRVYFPRVYRFALKRLGDPGEAEDVTQEVFMTVFRSLHTYAGNSSLLVWIFGITRNKVNRRFRGVRPRFEVIDADPRRIRRLRICNLPQAAVANG